MAVAGAVAGTGAAASATPGKPGKKKMLLLLAPALLAAISAGLWFGGVLKPLLGAHKPAASATQGAAPASNPVAPPAPVFFEMPEIVSNLNAGRRDSFIKLHARLELSEPKDTPIVAAALPRLQDLFQTYLREMHPEELRGSAGSWRLREELIARANIAAAPARIVDVLFTEMLIQ